MGGRGFGVGGAGERERCGDDSGKGRKSGYVATASNGSATSCRARGEGLKSAGRGISAKIYIFQIVKDHNKSKYRGK